MLSFIDLCLRRPVSVTAFYVLVLILAGLAYVRLPVALLPSLRFPSLAVWTAYPNVPPERVERTVTERVEEAVAGTSGLLSITSRSVLGGALVKLDFGWNTDLDLAFFEVREQLDRLGDLLPDEAERPVILHLDPSDRPIMILALSDATTTGPPPRQSGTIAVRGAAGDADSVSQQTLVSLRRLGRDVITRRLEQIDGVARAQITGGFEREVHLVVHPEKLAAYGLGLDQIGAALRAANVALPSGLIRRGPFQYAVEVSGEFQSLEDIAATVVSPSGQPPIRLRDIADVREGVRERRGLVRLDGRESLLLLLDRRPSSNTVETAAEVRRALEDLHTELPGVRIDVVVDESTFIVASIDGVLDTLFLGGLLSVAVLFAFLRHPRTALAVASSVPLSLAMTLVLFELFDIGFNLISLGGLALGVGMLMDNAIVVAENAARLRDQGQNPTYAALVGTREVAGAITTGTLTNIVVFLPLTFVEGLAGRLFFEQSLAVVFSLLSSLVVALTAVPLLLARGRYRPPATALPRVMPAWIRLYERGLAWSLAHRRSILSATFVFLLATSLLSWRLPREVIPETPLGQLSVRASLPPETDLDLVSRTVRVLEAPLQQAPGVERVLADLGERNEAMLDLDPRPTYEADLTLLLEPGAATDSLVATIQQVAARTGISAQVRAVHSQLDALLVADETDLIIDIVSEQRARAEEVIADLLRRLSARPELANVARMDELQVSAYQLRLRRDALARFGVRPDVVATHVEALARGREATAFRTVNEEIPILLKLEEVGSIEALLEARVPAGSALLPLHTFVAAERVQLPAALMRADQRPVIRLTADIAAESDLAEAVRAIESTLADGLPAPVQAEVRGANEAFQSSLRAVALSLLFSVVLMYLVLASQFESLLQPFIVLLTIPLAGGGVALVLWLSGQTVNLMSLIGLVVLIGIVDNDAIVKIDFINQQRRAGKDLYTAVMEAGRDRVRPIVMNTLTVAIGLIPLALGIGTGGELRAPLAIVIAGGLLSATVLSLFVVPVLYTFLSARRPPS